MTHEPARRPARAIGAALVALIALAALAPAAEARGVTVAGRPLHLHIPPGYTGSTAVPLVILIHGMQVTSTLQESYMRLAEQSDLRGFIYAYPDGLRESVGPFWNGAICCQEPFTPPVDDVAYINAIIDYVRDHYRLDERRVFIIGHSNGAFMASRFACESNRAAAIVTLGGGQYLNPSTCGWRPSPAWWLPPIPVPPTTSVLHIHATGDLISPFYWSWSMFAPFGTYDLPSGQQTVVSWISRNGCAPVGTPAGVLDLDGDVPGAETSRVIYPCAFAWFEFWTMNGSNHIPNFARSPASATFGATAINWLFSRVS